MPRFVISRRLDARAAPDDPIRVERVIGVTRVIVSSVALFAVWIHRSKPVRHASCTCALVSTVARLATAILEIIGAGCMFIRGHVPALHGQFNIVSMPGREAPPYITVPAAH